MKLNIDKLIELGWIHYCDSEYWYYKNISYLSGYRAKYKNMIIVIAGSITKSSIFTGRRDIKDMILRVFEQGKNIKKDIWDYSFRYNEKESKKEYDYLYDILKKIDGKEYSDVTNQINDISNSFIKEFVLEGKNERYGH